jgi:hypothetical protein
MPALRRLYQSYARFSKIKTQFLRLLWQTLLMASLSKESE